MLDISRIRENPKKIEEKLRSRDKSISIDDILNFDRERRNLLNEIEEKRHERNEGSQKIGNLKKEGKDEQASQLIEEMSDLGEEIDEKEEKLEEVERKLQSKMEELPNVPHESVPVSDDEEDKVILEEYGSKPEFDFSPKNHLQLGEKLNLLDFEKGAKIAGSRFPFYTGRGATLEMALIQLMFFFQVKHNDYLPIFPPFLGTEESFYTSAQLPKFSEDVYSCPKDELYLNPTAESILVNVHREEILGPSALPKKYVAYTTCFRREAGSYGEEERGLIRTHQFNKVELFHFVKPGNSYDTLEVLIENAKSVIEELGLHFRVAKLPTCDLAQQAAKTIDLEIWLPGQGEYYEVSSCSNCEDFQSRRGNIRYRPEKEGKPRYLHTLNGSGLATSRLLAAILENNQNPDGSVDVPEPLGDITGFDVIT